MVTCLSYQAWSQAVAPSAVTKKALDYGLAAAMIRTCNTPMDDAQKARLQEGLERRMKSQTELSPEDFQAFVDTGVSYTMSHRRKVCKEFETMGVTRILDTIEQAG